MISALQTAVLQVTTACHLSCAQCYMKHTGIHMSLPTARDILLRAKELGAEVVQLTGGEPMTYPWLADVVLACKHLELLSVVATSGIDHHRLRELMDAGLTAVCVSLNSIDPVVNGNTRQLYDQAVAAIREAVGLELPCFVNLVLTHDSVKTLRQTANALEDMGVSGLILLKRFPNSEGEGGDELTREEMSAVRDCVCQKRDFIQVERCCGAYWARYYGLTGPCTEGGRRSAFWNADGTVSPCSQKTGYAYATVEAMQADVERWSGNCN